jgi:zinc transport system substrate-binding protein
MLLPGKSPLASTLPVLSTGYPSTPIVLVSVAPLATIVRDLWPSARVQVLMDASEDFHHFQWRPAQMARVQQADWVVWLGPQQEPALVSTLRRLPSEKVITLFAAQPVAAPDNDHDPAPHRDQPQSAHADIHLWLDPAAVAKLVMILGERWQMQVAAVQQQQLHRAFWLRWQARLAPLTQRAFVIQHDAIGSWVQYFSLTQRFAITSDHEHEPGVQQLWQMRQQLQRQNQTQQQSTPVVCYLQTQANDPWWPKMSADLTPPIKTAILDLFSARDYAPVDGSHYLGFIQQNLEKLESCLR